MSEPEFAARVLEASKQVPVLVDFWASWCGPCKMLAPTLTKLADAYNGRFMLAKVNTDEEPRLAREYGVRALPTVKVFKDGRVVDEFMGVLPESAVRAVIERHVEHESDKLRRQAEASLEAGDTATARRLLEGAAELDPDNPAIKIATAKMLMFTGAADRAQFILQSLPVDVSMNPEVKRLQAQIGFAQVASTAAFDESELQRIISTDPKDLQARYRLSAKKVLRGDYEGALEQLFEILRQDRSFEDDAGRRGMLSVFEILGGSGELVSRYRAKMLNMLH
ncbi:MAG TPA: thioredoxin [Gammaproteobacteria bacterium]|nr:thioredoxin [Gammaproteobacteria bacterium]